MESKSKLPNKFKLLDDKEHEALSDEEKRKYSEELGEYMIETQDQITNGLIGLYNILKDLSESDLNEKDE